MADKLLFIGHSHTTSVRRAQYARQSRGDEKPEIRTIHVWAEQYLADSNNVLYGVGNLLRADIEQAVAEGFFPISCAGGNQHTVLGMVQHPEPFDFYLGERPDLPIEAGAKIVPEATIAAYFREVLKRELKTIAEIAAIVPKLHQIESPPPVGSRKHIEDASESYFKDRGMLIHGISPSWLRYKLWRMNSAITRQACESYGAIFVETPAAALEDGAFLPPDMYSEDSTHGGQKYGEALIDHFASY